ncbi:MAG: DUF3084 domain-containing protein [Armatimonadota bacterium]
MVVLIVVSGFIAYFGDLLGRRMGKKRLMLFGVRPRYTAIIVTTITGMVISALVLGTLLSINSDFKDAFTHWQQIKTQNRRLDRESNRLEARNKSLTSRSRLLEIDVARLQKEAETARRETLRAVKARDVAVASVASLKKEILGRKRQLDALRAKSAATEKELRTKTAQLGDVRSRLNIAENSLHAKQADLRSALSRLTTANARLFQTQSKLAEASKTLQEQQSAIQEQQTQLSEQQRALVEEGKRAISFQRQTTALRSSELVFRQGDELGRAVVSPRQSAFGIQGDLFSLLQSASDRADKLGAKVGDNQRSISVIYMLDADHFLPERTCIQMAVNTISGSYQDAVVQVVCTRNTIAGEQVPVELKLYLNNLIFPKDKLISRTRIDGRASEGRILLSVIDFLQKEVSEAALRSGIIPISNPDPRVTSGKDPTSQVENLMAVVDDVKQVDSKVYLYAYASADVYAAGPLNMDNMRFVVRKID